jgi:hypothetical protein
MALTGPPEAQRGLPSELSVSSVVIVSANRCPLESDYRTTLSRLPTGGEPNRGNFRRSIGIRSASDLRNRLIHAFDFRRQSNRLLNGQLLAFSPRRRERRRA